MSRIATEPVPTWLPQLSRTPITTETAYPIDVVTRPGADLAGLDAAKVAFDPQRFNANFDRLVAGDITSHARAYPMTGTPSDSRGTRRSLTTHHTHRHGVSPMDSTQDAYHHDQRDITDHRWITVGVIVIALAVIIQLVH